MGAATLCTAVVRLSEPVAIHPWEPAIAMEAVRLNAGLPLYESGHATHMYGPLLTAALAGVFRVTGLNLLAGRIVFSIFAFGLAIFLSTILSRNELRRFWWLALLLFLGINLRTNLIFFSAQPDCIAFLLAMIGAWFWIRERRMFLAIPFFICATLFKQTAAAFALIPIVHALIWTRPLRLRNFLRSLVPASSILLALAVIRFVWPQMFAAIVTVPSSIKVYPEHAVRVSLYLFATFPLFLVALLFVLRRGEAMNETRRWIFSAIVVLVPTSIWAISKSGGSYNSLLPAYLAMTALFVVELGRISDWLKSQPMARCLLASAAIVVVILISYFVQADRTAWLLSARYGDEKYDAAVKKARDLGGGVISPQDPTIAYRANGHFGRSLFFELDTHAVNGNWPNEVPASLLEELQQAKYVIAVHGFVPTPMFEPALAQNGFHQVSFPELQNSAYTVWGKTTD